MATKLKHSGLGKRYENKLSQEGQNRTNPDWWADRLYRFEEAVRQERRAGVTQEVEREVRRFGSWDIDWGRFPLTRRPITGKVISGEAEAQTRSAFDEETVKANGKMQVDWDHPKRYDY